MTSSEVEESKIKVIRSCHQTICMLVHNSITNSPETPKLAKSLFVPRLTFRNKATVKRSEVKVTRPLWVAVCHHLQGRGHLWRPHSLLLQSPNGSLCDFSLQFPQQLLRIVLYPSRQTYWKCYHREIVPRTRTKVDRF